MDIKIFGLEDAPREMLIKEIMRLRAALEDIANHTDVNSDECAGIARRALNQQTAGGDEK